MSRATACSPAALTALLLLLTSLLLFSCRSSEPPAETKPSGSKTARTTPPPLPAASVSIGPLIVFEEPDLPTPEAAILTPPPLPKDAERLPVGGKKRPRIAIIIDDMGHHRQMGRRLLQIDLDLTFSFLPDAPYTTELEEAAFQLGRDILVHLPMEPKNAAWNSGRETLTMRDHPKRIREKTARMLDAVPHAVGASNHMGSRFTEDAGAMQVVIESLRKRSFFFIDSYTTTGSQGIAAARLLGVPVARRHVFLDNDQELLKICQQLDRLVALAKTQGWAIGIGHPNEATYGALTRCSRGWLREVEIVGVHQLVQ